MRRNLIWTHPIPNRRGYDTEYSFYEDGTITYVDETGMGNDKEREILASSIPEGVKKEILDKVPLELKSIMSNILK